MYDGHLYIKDFAQGECKKCYYYRDCALVREGEICSAFLDRQEEVEKQRTKWVNILKDKNVK